MAEDTLHICIGTESKQPDAGLTRALASGTTTRRRLKGGCYRLQYISPFRFEAYRTFSCIVVRLSLENSVVYYFPREF